MKYKKRPIVVEAVQYLGKGVGCAFLERPAWLFNAVYEGDIFRKDGELNISTLEGELRVSKNDYIIRGIDGEIYPCKPDIFERAYELIEGGE